MLFYVGRKNHKQNKNGAIIYGVKGNGFFQKDYRDMG